jgi:hypothetical protein
MLSDHVISLGHTDDHDPFVRPKGEIYRTDKVADILDEEVIHVVQGEVLEGVFDEVRVEVTLFAGVDIGRRDSVLDEPLIVVVPLTRRPL